MARELTTEQQAAVDADGRRIAVLAGAGTGKTTVLIQRTVRKIQDGEVPTSILLLTFSRRAAGELERRVAAQVPHDETTGKPVTSTLHAFCADLIRQHGSKIGLGSDFGVYDRTDAEAVLRSAGVYMGVRGALTCRIGTLRRHQATMELYAQRLREANALDYDALEEGALALLRQHEVAHTFSSVGVDEAQDLSARQWQILEALGVPLFVVGDARQCIYAWRGAAPDRLQAWFKAADVQLHLTTNFRSGHVIVSRANRIMGRYPPLVSGRSMDDEVGTVEQLALADEWPGVARRAVEYVSLGSVAVLARTWRELRGVRQALPNDVPVHYHGPEADVWNQTNGRQFARFVQLLANPYDDNLAAQLATWGNWRSTWHEARARAHAARTRKAVIDVASEVGDWWTDPGKLPLLKCWQEVRSRMHDHRSVGDVLELVQRAATDGALQGVVADLDRMRSRVREMSMPQFLAWWAYGRQEQDRAAREGDGLHLLTVHAAKGLEYDHVFIIGCDGSWPRLNAPRWRRSEEIRLAYVAMTRARNTVILTRPISAGGGAHGLDSPVRGVRWPVWVTHSQDRGDVVTM